MSDNEVTPLLGDDSAARDNDERQNGGWLSRILKPVNVLQILSALSILWCIHIYVGGYFITLVIGRSGSYLNLPGNLDIQLAFAAQTWFWTAFVSFLNFARLRRSGIGQYIPADLPWWFNLIVDVSVFFGGLFVSLLYFTTNATVECRRRYRYPYDGTFEPDCDETEISVRNIGTVIMIGFLLLSLTHGVLLVVRLCRLPSLPNVVRNPSSWREEGWFIGIGRGPLHVNNIPASAPEAERNLSQSV